MPPPLASLAQPGAAPREFHPSLSLFEEYSDNFFLSSTDKTDNFRTTVTPGFTLLLNEPNANGVVAAGFGITQDSVDTFGDLGFFPSLSATLKYNFTPRFSVSLVDTFTRSDEPALANQFGLQQERQTFNANTLTLSADWLLDQIALQGYYQLSVFFGDTDTVSNIAGVSATVPIGALMAARAGYEFSYSNTSGTSNVFGTGADYSTGNLVWGSVARRFGPWTSLGASTSYSWQTLESARIWNISLFGVRELPGRFSLSGSVGYSLLTSDAGGDFSAFSTDSTASYRFERAVISVAVYQDFNTTFLQGQNFGITLTRSYTGLFGYALTPSINVGVRASYSQNEPTGVGNTESSPNSDAFTAGAGLTWRIRQWLTGALDYTYARYSSVGGSGDAASENRVTLRLTASF